MYNQHLGIILMFKTVKVVYKAATKRNRSCNAMNESKLEENKSDFRFYDFKNIEF